MVKWICALFMTFGIALTTPTISAECSQALLRAKQRSEQVETKLRSCSSITEKKNQLLQDGTLQEAVKAFPQLKSFIDTASPQEGYVIALLASLGQANTVFSGVDELKNPNESLHRLAQTLIQIDAFYQPIGGLLGYHSTVINLMTGEAPPFDAEHYLPPPVQDIRTKSPEVWKACYDGVANLPSTASIFALGGAGDRLNLIDETTGEPLPAARFLFCGRSFFEGLMRDVEAQEYWHYRVFGRQATMPILIMTSSEKNNDFHIEAMGNASNWFGHRKTAIRRMVQPLVPVIDTEGQYAVSAPLTLSLKPGGHGVIWKLAEDSGAIAWLSSQGIKAAIVRQVNNPLAGLDHALLTFIGHGIGHTKSFGFLSCPSRPGFAEGLNALFVKKASGQTEAAISNIEYTQFNTLKNLLPDLFKEGVCPANTNILYVNLSQINNALAKNPIPGMIVNAKTNIEGIKNGVAFKKNGGRLESCMQNLSEGMMSPLGPQKPTSVSSEALSTFLLLQDRDKLMSAIKKSYQPGQNPQETPIACLYDQNRAMRSLLTSSCQFTLPDEQTLDDFVKNGPSFMFSFHPAMGPLWDVIGQKLSKGTIFPKSHVDLEISEIDCKNLSINGSLKILATRITGIFSASFEKTFTNDVGRARLHNVTIVNKGPKALDFASILKGTVPQEECCEIVLEGLSELVASNITITGPFHLIVPNGKRATLTQDASGKILTTFDAINAPSWQYTVTWQKGCAPKLALLESA